MSDVRVSFVQFDPVSTTINVSWVQFDPVATDVRVSWVQFDPLAGTVQPTAPVGGGYVKKKYYETDINLLDEQDILDILLMLSDELCH